MIPSIDVVTQNINFNYHQQSSNSNNIINNIDSNNFNLMLNKINNNTNNNGGGVGNNQYFKQIQDEINLNMDIKCLHHNQLDLISVCEECCVGVCIVCMDEEHKNHKISEIGKLNAREIIDNYKHNQYPNIIAYRESDKIVTSAVDHCFGLVESRHQSNLIKIHEKFKSLHQVLLDLESNVTMILEANHSDNEELYSKIKIQLQSDSDSIDTLVSRYNQLIENNVILETVTINNTQNHQNQSLNNLINNQLLTIVKDTEECSQLIGKKKLNRFQPFLDYTINFDQDLEDVFIESINNFYSIESREFKDKDNQYLMINKLSKGGTFNFYLSHGEPIPDDISSLGLSSNIKNGRGLKIPNTIKELHFLNGFNHQIDAQLMPNGVQKLFFYDIVKPLRVGSIPGTVKELYFCSGYSHTIEPGVIPSTVQKIVLYDIKQPLQLGSITHGCTELHLNNGFNQFILPNIIPESVEKLYLYEIKQPLLSGCIPSTLKELYLRSGFSHQITPSIIPHTLKLLYIGDIKQKLNQGSIPFGIKEIHFGNGFDQLLTSDLIPASVESLFLYNIKHPLTAYSIPSTVRELQFGNGYNHLISPKSIPSNISRLIIYSFKPPIIKGSVPITIKELYLFKGVYNQLTPGLIPDQVKVLNI